MERTFVDSTVFLDLFTQSQRAERAREYLRQIQQGKRPAATSTFALLEVKYHLRRRLGHEKAEQAAYIIQTIPHLAVFELTQTIAAMAADIRFKYYDKKQKPVSFGDAIHIATAVHAACTRILTADSDFLGLDEIKAETY
ncbi:MAG: type II toxin-antitoxin system VapC family toxin [Candidatus Micrarchaeota archaeon]|nr:type II toxin-antitoxin system VapC family toxin [Candidatus Micrarchaeota archaeon]